MAQWRPSIGFPWTPTELEGVLTDALRVLEEIGIGCDLAEVADRLGEWDGASCAQGRVHFAAEKVREHIAARRSPPGPEEPEEGPVSLTMGGNWAGLNYCDPETLEIRPGTSEEARQMIRLWDARGVGGVVPLAPGDVPPELVALKAEHLGITNSENLGGSLPVTDPEEIRYLIDMNLAAGRRYRLMQQTGISPLRFNSEGLGIALLFLENPDVDLSVGGFIPVCGATCPLDPRSAVVQSVAETLSHDILCATLGVAGGGFGLRAESFDFQYSTVVFGSPEWCLYCALILQMTEHVSGIRPRYGKFRSTAKLPDPQAACERTASVMWQALLGGRSFGGVGQLSVDEVFSPQQVIIDQEILRYVERLVSGVDLSAEVRDPIALIREGVEEGNFLAVEDTVSRFRELYMFPDLFRHWNVGRWRAEGSPSVLSMAWERARELMAQSDFQLPEEQQREVGRIYDKAVGHVQQRGRANGQA